jgi:flagellar basal body-associated protein FliL
MKLSVIFTVLNQLKIDHWQTKSYAEHKALGIAYESLDSLFDKFIELYYGKNNISDARVTYTVKSDSYSDNLLSIYTTMRDSVISYLSTITEGQGDLRNIQDEIESEFNHLLYRLQQK